jgi:hypothetical protein
VSDLKALDLSGNTPNEIPASLRILAGDRRPVLQHLLQQSRRRRLPRSAEGSFTGNILSPAPSAPTSLSDPLLSPALYSHRVDVERGEEVVADLAGCQLKCHCAGSPEPAAWSGARGRGATLLRWQGKEQERSWRGICLARSNGHWSITELISDGTNQNEELITL